MWFGGDLRPRTETRNFDMGTWYIGVQSNRDLCAISLFVLRDKNIKKVKVVGDSVIIIKKSRKAKV